MDDELEDKVFYQTYISHMKLLSKFAVGIPPFNSSMAYLWRLFRLYFVRPEVLFCAIIIFVFVLYLQAVDLWSRGLLGRISTTFGYSRPRMQLLNATSPAERQSWEEIKEYTAVYAVQGRRPKMEDRFFIAENVNQSGISFYAVFDGHGGEFAADYAKDHLIKNMLIKIQQTTNILRGGNGGQSNFGEINRINCGDGNKKAATTTTPSTLEKGKPTTDKDKENEKTTLQQRRGSFRKSYSTAEDCGTKGGNCNRESDVFLDKINSIVRTKDSFLNTKNANAKPPEYEAKCYIENGKINFGKMLTDEVLSVDYDLVEAAKKNTNMAGTTALMAILDKTRLIVANVGDSRGVMCDIRGNAIPLSFDHKPQQVRERKRIHDAGGFIAFKGVWRVAGILATSRALGDYPLKDKKLVIADPDILSFDLDDHRPMFLILASDGLWDTFSNEEAVAFIKDHLNEPHFGAKSLTLQSYYRGSVDNITVLVIVFKDGKYQIGTSSM